MVCTNSRCYEARHVCLDFRIQQGLGLHETQIYEGERTNERLVLIWMYLRKEIGIIWLNRRDRYTPIIHRSSEPWLLSDPSISALDLIFTFPCLLPAKVIMPEGYLLRHRYVLARRSDHEISMNLKHFTPPQSHLPHFQNVPLVLPLVVK